MVIKRLMSLLKKKEAKKITLLFFILITSFVSSLSFAEDSNEDTSDFRTDTAKAAQKIQTKMHPTIQLPLSYNYNQNKLPNQSYTQAQFQFTPIIPFAQDETHAFVVNPLFTDNVNSQNQQITNQATPLQIATYFEVKSPTFIYGIGPFIQMPTANLNSGSQQTGLGVSYGAYYTPKNWTIGANAYNAFAVGGSSISGSANIYYFNPTISYTTDNAYTINLQSWINGNPTNGHSQNNNQLILSVGNTIKINEYHLQWAIGPTYMVTATPTTPQGLGGYFSLTFAFKEH